MLSLVIPLILIAVLAVVLAIGALSDPDRPEPQPPKEPAIRPCERCGKYLTPFGAACSRCQAAMDWADLDRGIKW